MNRRYYGRIYLNPSPTSLDMSMLDNNDMLGNEKTYRKRELLVLNEERTITFAPGGGGEILNIAYTKPAGDTWIKVACNIKSINGSWNGSLNSSLTANNEAKHNYVRLVNPLYHHEQTNPYVFYVHVPATFNNGVLKVYINSPDGYQGAIDDVLITELSK